MITVLFIVLYVSAASWVVWRSTRFGCGLPAMAAAASRFAVCSAGLVWTLPFGGADGVTFEIFAWRWSQLPLEELLGTFNVTASYVISSIIALFYKLLERNIAIPIFINGILGVLIFYYSLVLASTVWRQCTIKNLFPWIVALHPMLNVNSGIVLRENYVILFLILAMIQLAKFVNSGRGVNVLGLAAFLFLAACFHNGVLLMAFGLPLFFVLNSRSMIGSKRIAVMLLFLGALATLLYNVEFNKINEIQSGAVFDAEYLEEIEARRRQANTAYLVGMAPSSIVDVFWQVPIRITFFLLKPFPWDLVKAEYVLVFMDALLWFLIVWIICGHWREISRNPAAFAILLCLVVGVAAFAYGTSNFGTGVRHRTKFLVLALAIVYPYLPRVRFRVSEAARVRSTLDKSVSATERS